MGQVKAYYWDEICAMAEAEEEDCREYMLMEYVGARPTNCDICGEILTDVFVDGISRNDGAYHFMCEKCHAQHGVGLGPQAGNKYSIKQTKKIANNEGVAKHAFDEYNKLSYNGVVVALWKQIEIGCQNGCQVFIVREENNDNYILVEALQLNSWTNINSSDVLQLIGWHFLNLKSKA